MVRKKYVDGVYSEKTHYVFQGLEPIFEKRIKAGQADRIRSYVYAGMKLIARVDGVIGDTSAKKYWYHTDHLGSVKAVTKADGSLAWKADYLPFGQQHVKEKIDPTFEEDDLGFTGKGYDAEIGLYYFNARWYDADTGRFISEDPVGDPNNPNLYSGFANNPLKFIDPTGLAIMTTGNGGTYNTETGEYTPPGGSGGNSGGGIPSGSTSDGRGGYITSDEGGTYHRYSDGSSECEINRSNATRMPGVTENSSTFVSLDKDGNVVSGKQTTEFNKSGGGSVTIETLITGNVINTTVTLKDKDGNVVDSRTVTDIEVVGLRGWGSKLKTRPDPEGKNDIYDDALMVITRWGRIGIFESSNLEHTNVSSWVDAKGKVHKMKSQEKMDNIKDGVYELNYGWHNDKYECLYVNDNGAVTGKKRTMHGIHIHVGGAGWSYSEGCITIYDPSSDRSGAWRDYMSYFAPNYPLYTPFYVNRQQDRFGNTKGVISGQRAGTLVIATI